MFKEGKQYITMKIPTIKKISIAAGLYVFFVTWTFLAMYGAMRLAEQFGWL